MKNYLLSSLYNEKVAALQESLSPCPTFVPWDVEIRPCTSGSSNECQQRASRSTELQFPPSITSISRSLFANSRALAKSFSSVVFLVRLSRQFGLTGWKAAWRSEFPLVTVGNQSVFTASFKSVFPGYICLARVKICNLSWGFLGAPSSDCWSLCCGCLSLNERDSVRW